MTASKKAQKLLLNEFKSLCKVKAIRMVDARFIDSEKLTCSLHSEYGNALLHADVVVKVDCFVIYFCGNHMFTVRR